MGVVMGLQWRDQLSVGNDLIDGDHKYLIDIINKVEVSMKANNRAELMALLDELGHYGKTHFEREELVAKAVGPGSGLVAELTCVTGPIVMLVPLSSSPVAHASDSANQARSGEEGQRAERTTLA